MELPRHAPTRAGLRWSDNGSQLDLLLEYGRVESYPERTSTTIGIVDQESPFTESISAENPARLRFHYGIQLHWGIRATQHDHFWLRTVDAEWIRDPPVMRRGDEIEIVRNQIRISPPLEFLELTGQTDPRVSRLDWHVSVMDEAVSGRIGCLGLALLGPWPLDLDQLNSLFRN